MQVTWIGGWGVAPESLQPVAEMYFPGSQHTILAPTVKAAESLAQALTRPSGTRSPFDPVKDSPDLTVAWSLGAWRVIEAASRGVELPGMVLLLAPFVAFPAESRLGGKCSTTQVKFLRRWLQRDPLAAIADFYQRAGLFHSQPLPGGEPDRAGALRSSPSGKGQAGVGRFMERKRVMCKSGKEELPYALPELLEGLDRLAEDAAPALREFAACGIPRNWQAFVGDNDPLLDGAAVCRLLPGCTLLPGAGHDIADLLRASQAK